MTNDKSHIAKGERNDSHDAVSDTPSTHIPVLLHESIDALCIAANRDYVDATAGQGGHSALMLERCAPRGRVCAIEWDDATVLYLQRKFSVAIAAGRYLLAADSFANMADIVRKAGLVRVWGVLFDFGFSRMTIEQSGRGFSFSRDEPLSMAYREGARPDARDILHDLSEEELASLLWKFGGERFSRRIAAGIIRARSMHPIGMSKELADIVWNAYPAALRHRRIHPATRTFQALRIAVNRELENIESALPQAIAILEPGARIVAITYHSLEDRIVKYAFRSAEADGAGKQVLKKPLIPAEKELVANPSSRSAKMRVFEKK